MSKNKDSNQNSHSSLLHEFEVLLEEIKNVSLTLQSTSEETDRQQIKDDARDKLKKLILNSGKEPETEMLFEDRQDFFQRIFREALNRELIDIYTIAEWAEKGIFAEEMLHLTPYINNDLTLPSLLVMSGVRVGSNGIPIEDWLDSRFLAHTSLRHRYRDEVLMRMAARVSATDINSDANKDFTEYALEAIKKDIHEGRENTILDVLNVQNVQKTEAALRMVLENLTESEFIEISKKMRPELLNFILEKQILIGKSEKKHPLFVLHGYAIQEPEYEYRAFFKNNLNTFFSTKVNSQGLPAHPNIVRNGGGMIALEYIKRNANRENEKLKVFLKTVFASVGVSNQKIEEINNILGSVDIETLLSLLDFTEYKEPRKRADADSINLTILNVLVKRIEKNQNVADLMCAILAEATKNPNSKKTEMLKELYEECQKSISKDSVIKKEFTELETVRGFIKDCSHKKTRNKVLVEQMHSSDMENYEAKVKFAFFSLPFDDARKCVRGMKHIVPREKAFQKEFAEKKEVSGFIGFLSKIASALHFKNSGIRKLKNTEEKTLANALKDSLTTALDSISKYAKEGVLEELETFPPKLRKGKVVQKG